jgi:4-oxalocrotonate tautomerase
MEWFCAGLQNLSQRQTATFAPGGWREFRRRQIQRRGKMPLIEVKLIEEVFTPKQKNEIIAKLTEAMVSIEGENMRGVTLVTIDEVKSGSWGIGGKAMTTEMVKAIASGKAPA